MAAACRVFGFLETRYPGIKIVPAMSSGGTDGMHFRRAGVPTYGTGADFTILGNTSNAHGLNERFTVDFFYEGLDHWMVMIRELASD